MLEIVPMCRIPASTKPGAALPQGQAIPLPGRSDLSPRRRPLLRENRRRDAGDPLSQGIAYRLDPATYGE